MPHRDRHDRVRAYRWLRQAGFALSCFVAVFAPVELAFSRHVAPDHQAKCCSLAATENIDIPRLAPQVEGIGPVEHIGSLIGSNRAESSLLIRFGARVQHASRLWDMGWPVRFSGEFGREWMDDEAKPGPRFNLTGRCQTIVFNCQFAFQSVTAINIGMTFNVNPQISSQLPFATLSRMAQSEIGGNPKPYRGGGQNSRESDQPKREISNGFAPSFLPEGFVSLTLTIFCIAFFGTLIPIIVCCWRSRML
jgi:hypothetical protein